MKNIIYLFLLLFSTSAYSQSLSVFNVDASNFPIIKANFFAFDSAGKQITNLNPSDFTITENGKPRMVANVSCPEQKNPVALSSVLVFDMSGSMSSGPPRIESAKKAANAWIDGLPLGESECALVSFSDNSYIVQDFTKNRQLLKNSVSSLSPRCGTNYNQALLDPPCGGLQVAKSGKYKKVIIFLTDGSPNFEPRTSTIITFAKLDKVTIYGVTLDMPAPQCIKDMTLQTGGIYFENITTLKEAEDTYTKLLNLAQGGDPCQIEWISEANCDLKKINLKIESNLFNSVFSMSYVPPASSVARLEITPGFIKFKNAIPDIVKDSSITITAVNADFNITNITSLNPAYTITPSSFFLSSGESRNIDVSYLPADSSYTFTKFTIENNNCPKQFYASGGFPGKVPKIQTLKLIHPNGGETFIVGMDTIITWEGVLPEDKVIIEYTTDNGVNWTTITDSATGFSYNWLVPKTPSNQCLARVKAILGYLFLGCVGNEVRIDNQIWMCNNLDVDKYRDGTPIPEVKNPGEWVNLKTGAWCYYNNDPTNGAIYGKLYNWYAVNDIRGLAPVGWHIPSDTEWTVLENYLGGPSVAGGKLKEIGNVLWDNPNYGATNETGFSGLPGGYRDFQGQSTGIGSYCRWWSSTELDESYSWSRYLYFLDTDVYRLKNSKCDGFSVRCIKD